MAGIVINVSIIYDALPFLLRGALVTLEIASCGCFFGLLLGTVIGVIQSFVTHRFVRSLVALYITIIRGTPMLIQIAFAAYVLPELGLKLSPFWASIFAISLNSAAYVSQIVRSGIQAIHKGQLEAAYVLGFSRLQTIYYIVLPQAFQVIFPALGNEFITLVKDSSLASTIGVAELTKEAGIIKNRTFDALSVYCAVALFYLVITSTLSLVIAYIEKKVDRHARD